MDPRYLPQVVSYDGKHAPGTIVIDTPNKFLYLVQEDGKAKRYGIGVGRPGFTWAGVKSITRKAEWPDWVPPPEMLQRRPDLPRHMAGGPDNPLGARAMYLGSSLYRIHGSNEPWTIGTAVSSGCIRMRNEDVIDLYGRVKVGHQGRGDLSCRAICAIRKAAAAMRRPFCLRRRSVSRAAISSHRCPRRRRNRHHRRCRRNRESSPLRPERLSNRPGAARFAAAGPRARRRYR